MADKLNDIMTRNPRTLRDDATLADAAKLMAEAHTGAVLVLNDQSRLCGIVTDRDLVVRAIAAGGGPDTPVRNCLSEKLTALSPDDTIDQAIEVMRTQHVRRVPIMGSDGTLGIVSLGDLARHRDPDSVLGQISSAPAND